MNIMAGSLGGRIPPVRSDRLAVLSVVVNATCNLQCRHCYLSPAGPPIGMRSEQWHRFLRSTFADLRPHSVCFSGKEIFSLRESVDLFFGAIRMRDTIQGDHESRTRIGVVTNGTRVGSHRDMLSATPPDWLDISIDGVRDSHDAIRGRGAFNKVARNLPWLLEVLSDRLWIATTLMDTNVDSLPEIVSSLNQEFGLRRFSVGLYKPQSYTDSLLRLNDVGREDRTLQALLGLNAIDVNGAVDVKFEFDSRDTSLLRRMEQEGLIPREGFIRVGEQHLDNGVTLRITTTAGCVGLWRAARVTNEGLYIAAEDLVDATSYGKRAIGHIADFDYDARKLYEAGLVHSRFRELLGSTSEQFFNALARNA